MSITESSAQRVIYNVGGESAAKFLRQDLLERSGGDCFIERCERGCKVIHLPNSRAAANDEVLK